MPPAKKRKLEGTSNAHAIRTASEAQEPILHESHVSDESQNTGESPAIDSDSRVVTINKERQERFKALQARAVCLHLEINMSVLLIL